MRKTLLLLSSRWTPLKLPWLLYYRCGKSVSYQDTGLTAKSVTDGATVKGVQDLSSPFTPATLVGSPAAFPTLNLNVLDGQPVWRFNGTHSLSTQDVTQVPLTKGYLAFIGRVTGGAAADFVCGGRSSTSGNPIFSLKVSTGPVVGQVNMRNDAAGSGNASVASAGSSWQLTELVWDGSNVAVYQGGVQKGTTAFTGTVTCDRFAVGGDWYQALAGSGCLTGDVAVQGIMTRVPTVGQLAKLRKWVKSNYPSVPVS